MYSNYLSLNEFMSFKKYNQHRPVRKIREWCDAVKRKGQKRVKN
jgi:hypothetical protein